MYFFNHIYLLPSFLQDLPYFPTLYSLKKKKNKYNLCRSYTLGCVAFHWSILPARGHTLKENQLFLSQYLSIAKSSLARHSV